MGHVQHRPRPPAILGHPPAAAIRAALAPFERGGRGDVPDEWLAFHDETEHVRALHAAEFVITTSPGGGTRIEGGDAHYLDIDAVLHAMAERGVDIGP